jgi:hypothetical protein
VTQNLPEYVQPYAVQAMERAAALSNTPYTPYTGQRMADLTPENVAGLNMITNRALTGSPEENLARMQYGQTMAGDYLSPDANPYFSRVMDRALGDVQSRLNSQFAGSNFGTTAHQESMARALGDVSAGAYSQQYQNEREAQQRAMSMYPQFANIDYQNAQQLLGVGDIYRGEAQAGLNQQYSDWLAQQADPYTKLDVLSQGIRGAMAGGGSSASTYTGSQSPMQVNPTANALGGAVAGGALGGMFGQQYMPMGAAAGGLLGLWG